MTRHLYRCPLRWADMDQLGHVNNVTYVDYLQEARVDMLREHPLVGGGEELAEGAVVVRHEVTYVVPLVFRAEPVSVEVWVTEITGATFTLAYEIFDEDPDGTRTVYVRARSLLAPYVFAEERPRRLARPEVEVLERFLEPHESPLGTTVDASPAPAERRFTYPCAVRFSDVDAYRHVNNVKHFEYFQEARVALVTSVGGLMGGSGIGVVVAHVDVDYRAPMFFREAPYAVDVWVSRIGRSSFVVSGEVRDGEQVLSRSEVVMVAFDPRTQRSVALTDEHRDRLRAWAAP